MKSQKLRNDFTIIKLFVHIILVLSLFLLIHPFSIYDIDLGILSLLFMFFLVFVNKNHQYPKDLINFIFLYFALMMFSLFYFMFGSISSYFLLRSIRAFVTAFVLILAFFNYSRVTILKTLFYVLLVQTLSIHLGFYFYSFKALIGEILNVKEVLYSYNLRSFGLVSSYDTAGFLVISLLFVYSLLCFEKIYKFRLLLFLFFSVSGFMTGRTFIIIYFIILLFYLFKVSSKSFNNFLCYLSVFFVSIIIIAINKESVFLFFGFCADCDYQSSRYLSEGGFYTGSFNKLLYDSIALFPYIDNILFGSTSSGKIDQTDVGYIKIILEMGVIGLLVYLLPILYFIYEARNKRLFGYFLILFSLVYLFFNFKILALGARGFHEVFVVLFICLCKYRIYGDNRLYVFKSQ